MLGELTPKGADKLARCNERWAVGSWQYAVGSLQYAVGSWHR